MKTKHLLLQLDHNDTILRVKINRPEVRNAFNEELIREFHQIFAAITTEEKDFDKVRAVLLSGEGPTFCGGGDLNWMKRSMQLSQDENIADCQQLTQMFLAMDRVPVPVIGLVHGFAIGGGVGLVSICDHVIAATDATFSLSEVKLGLIPACIGPFVLGKIGFSQARSLFLSGERFTAEKAKAIGLVHEVVSKEELTAAGDKVLERILEGGPDAIKAAKYLLHTLHRDLSREPFDRSLEFAAAELANLRVRPEAQEGLKAFLEKRAPSWRN